MFSIIIPTLNNLEYLKLCIKSLKNNNFKKINIPKFDKSIDDRLVRSKWLKVKKKPNIIIFEGWCVGVTSQKKKDLINPINKLEKQKDKKKIWRQKVNSELKNSYSKIFIQHPVNHKTNFGHF